MWQTIQTSASGYTEMMAYHGMLSPIRISIILRELERNSRIDPRGRPQNERVPGDWKKVFYEIALILYNFKYKEYLEQRDGWVQLLHWGRVEGNGYNMHFNHFRGRNNENR
jgi:hypothetical protein